MASPCPAVFLQGMVELLGISLALLFPSSLSYGFVLKEESGDVRRQTTSPAWEVGIEHCCWWGGHSAHIVCLWSAFLKILYPLYPSLCSKGICQPKLSSDCLRASLQAEVSLALCCLRPWRRGKKSMLKKKTQTQSTSFVVSFWCRASGRREELSGSFHT